MGRANLQGVSIRDGQAETELAPDATVSLPPGASLVVAGPRAEVDAGVRLAEPIGNGLGNQGDVVSLVDARGEVIDVVEYGAGARLAAPSAGVSLHRWFDADGRILGVANGPPTPGFRGPVPTDETDGVPPENGSHRLDGAEDVVGSPDGTVAATPTGRSEDRLAWMLLFAVVSGAFGGVGAQRVMSSRQRVRSRGGDGDDVATR